MAGLRSAHPPYGATVPMSRNPAYPLAEGDHIPCRCDRRLSHRGVALIFFAPLMPALRTGADHKSNYRFRVLGVFDVEIEIRQRLRGKFFRKFGPKTEVFASCDDLVANELWLIIR